LGAALGPYANLIIGGADRLTMAYTRLSATRFRLQANISQSPQGIFTPLTRYGKAEQPLGPQRPLRGRAAPPTMTQLNLLPQITVIREDLPPPIRAGSMEIWIPLTTP
jgi:hypothetical protein